MLPALLLVPVVDFDPQPRGEVHRVGQVVGVMSRESGYDGQGHEFEHVRDAPHEQVPVGSR